MFEAYNTDYTSYTWFYNRAEIELKRELVRRAYTLRAIGPYRKLLDRLNVYYYKTSRSADVRWIRKVLYLNGHSAFNVVMRGTLRPIRKGKHG